MTVATNLDDRMLRFVGSVVLLLAGYGLVQLSVREDALPLSLARERVPVSTAAPADADVTLRFAHPTDGAALAHALANWVEASGGALVEHAPGDGRVRALVSDELARELAWAQGSSWSQLTHRMERPLAASGGGVHALLLVEADRVRVLGHPVPWWQLALPGGLMCAAAAWVLGGWLHEALPSRNRRPGSPEIRTDENHS